MRTAVILGAGELGANVARQLAAAGVVSEIALVDDAESVAAGKALDIRQAGSIDGYVTGVAGTASIDAVIGASFIVVADRAAQLVEWQDDAAVGLLGRIAMLNRNAPILCAGASHAGLIERAVRETGVSRERVFGTAPEALRSAIAAITALEARCAATDVSLSVVGLPPREIIVAWEEASIAGRSATSVLSPPALSRLDARVPRLWPPGPVTLASAATRAIVSATSRAFRTVHAFVSISREQGAQGRVAMLPVLLSPRGIETVVTPKLTRRDQVRLETVLSR